MRKKITLLLVSCYLITSQCTKDYFDSEKLEAAANRIEWSPEFAIPLVYGSYSVDDLLSNASENAQSVVQTNAQNFITLVYKGEVASLDAQDLFILPDQNFSKDVPSGINLPLLPSGDSIVVPFSFSESFNSTQNSQLDSIRLNSGLLRLNLSSSFKHNVRLHISIPSLVSPTGIIERTVNLNYSGSIPVQETIEIDLSNTLVDLTNQGNSTNQLLFDIQVVVQGSGNAVSNSDKIAIDFAIEELNFKHVFGFLDVGGFSSEQDTIPISIFSSAQGIGTFSIANPSVKFIFENSIGLPMDISFQTLEGRNTNTGQNINLSTSPELPSPLPVPYVFSNQVGEVVSDSFTLQGPTMANFINNQPNQLVYAVNAQTASSANQSNFILDTSKLKVKAELKMPLEGTADIFGIYDTIPLSLESSSDSIRNIDILSLTLKSIIKNEFPIDFGIQLYVLDQNEIITDSLFDANTLIPSAQVSANGELIAPGVLDLEITKTEAELENIQQMKQIIIKASATTAGGGTQNVKIYSDYKFNVQLGVKSKILTSF